MYISGRSFSQSIHALTIKAFAVQKRATKNTSDRTTVSADARGDLKTIVICKASECTLVEIKDREETALSKPVKLAVKHAGRRRITLIQIHN